MTCFELSGLLVLRKHLDPTSIIDVLLFGRGLGLRGNVGFAAAPIVASAQTTVHDGGRPLGGPQVRQDR